MQTSSSPNAASSDRHPTPRGATRRPTTGDPIGRSASRWPASPLAVALLLATSAMWGADIAPAITRQPANQTVLAGNAATFSVAATGDPAPTYQWYQSTNTWVPGTYVWNPWGGYYTSGYWSTSNTPIANATGASYTTAATQLAWTGTTYFAVATNRAGTATSSNVTLTVASPVSITTQPASQTVTVGAKATFSVAATSSIALAYQWYRNGAAISGATGASYTTPATVLADQGATFSVAVSHAAATATSQAATLHLNIPPAITTQPANQSIALGSPVTFSATATGIPAPTYQWRRGGVAIPGATGSSYLLTATAKTDDNVAFSVVASNSVGSATSQNATLTLRYPPTITTQPQGQMVAVGGKATFSVVATVLPGTPAPTYQWFRDGMSLAGATGSSYTTPMVVLYDAGAKFTVRVSNPIGAVTSDPAQLDTTGSGPTIASGSDTFLVLNKQGGIISTSAGGTGNLYVEGTLRAHDVHTAHLLVQAEWWGDTVFAPDYRLMPLGEVKRYIQANQHLPGVADEATILKNGIQVNDMLASQMTKIEELTLHAIRQEETIEKLEQANQRQAEAIARMLERLDRPHPAAAIPAAQGK